MRAQALVLDKIFEKKKLKKDQIFPVEDRMVETNLFELNKAFK